MNKKIESLSPIERKIVPFLNLEINEIVGKSKLDRTTVLRALKFLEEKEILILETRRKEIIDLGTNGNYYKKNHLPERNLLSFLEKNNHIEIRKAKKQIKLSDNEFKAALGVLKRKSLIDLSNGKIKISTNKEELTKKFPEEKFLENLPLEKLKLSGEEINVLKSLSNRKNIIEIIEERKTTFNLTEEGKQLAGKQITSNFIEEVTSEMIKTGTKGKQFRIYDIKSQVPQLSGGKKHFVNQSIEYAKKIWTDLGFKEMNGKLIETAFWNFDTLFTAQDHSAREMQDSFYIKKIKGKLPDKKLVEKIKLVHEKGVSGSKGWRYNWEEEEAKKIVMRTHGTALSARTLANLKPEEIPAKYFAIGKVFRNETIDWSHGIEFYQTEGIVIDPDANFRHLLGYIKEFYKKMGFEKIRFRPSYFPYTEPSVEIDALHPERKIWLELGGAGIFRPEVVVPLLGKNIPVLAWGQGLDRIIMDFYKIQDLREMYSNDIKSLRNKKIWTK